ncbi:GapS6b family protein [Pseudoalteromonas arctica]|jgi:tetratricopeptide (TPR) repeat protein|uniref:PIN domain-containing protein n=1 Tax=Pseudoalteromonas arctica A 37-1-2 TaxID=1117313 RepID=A0A290SA34_9GAMM|nr:hypothetical protein [Pseudoalteromonas arctica]ATC89014.1 hypothetical protein PARC_p0041 [Pseudoalteromonas arctica A 37-1-2]
MWSLIKEVAELTKEPSVHQQTEKGHNVFAKDEASVEIVSFQITDLSSDGLETFIKEFARLVTHRCWSKALIFIESLKTVDKLDSECKSLLKVLEYKLHATQGKPYDIVPDLFLELIESERSTLIVKDIVEAAYLHFLNKISSERALKRYKSSKVAKSLSKETYFEKLAQLEELNEQISKGTVGIREQDLCSYVRCALRLGEYELSLDLAKELVLEHPNQNSTVLNLLCSAYKVHNLIGTKHFWMINQSLIDLLIETIESVKALSSKIDDGRVFQAAAVLLATTWFEDVDLTELCDEHIEEAEKVIPDIRTRLQTNIPVNTKPSNKLRAQNPEDINENDFPQLSMTYLKGGINKRQVKRWLDKGGNVTASKPQIKQFIEIFLSAIAFDPTDLRDKQKLSDNLEKYLVEYEKITQEINPQALYQLCLSLNQMGLNYQVTKIIEPLLPQKPWASPIIDAYSEALLGSEQFEKLDSFLANMDSEQDSYRLAAVRISREFLLLEFENANTLIQKSLARYPRSSYFWTLLIQNSIKVGLPESDIEKNIHEIPTSLFDDYSYEKLQLVQSISVVDVAFAESILLEWFIDDPAGIATHLTNIHFGTLSKSDKRIERSYPSDRCFAAATYRKGKKQFTKLLVEGCETNEYLLDVDSPLGEMLLEMDAGDSNQLGMDTVTLIEKLSPIVGAFRISLDIRSAINAGNDCFYQMTFNEQEGIDGLLKQIDVFSEQKQLIEPHIDGQLIPLLMRINRSFKYDIVKGAFIYLSDKESNKFLDLFSEGEPIVDKLVLDALSLVYFSYTGLASALIESDIEVYVSGETKNIVLTWLEQMGREDYLSVGKVDGNYFKKTAEDIAKDQNVKSLRELIEYCEELTPISFNVPEPLLRIKDILDISHYSSVKLSVSHGIPIFCLDTTFCNYYRTLELPIANVYQLVLRVKKGAIGIEERLARCNVFSHLRVPISHTDVINLCRSNETGQFLAAKILKMNSNSYHSPEIALQVLTECCIKSTCTAYLGTFESLDLSEWKFTENIVYACCSSAMQCLEGKYSENKFAQLIVEITFRLRGLNDVTKLVMELFRRFASGHFLDIQAIDEEIKRLGLLRQNQQGK